MSTQELTPQEEHMLAPLHLDLDVTLNGVRMVSRGFIRQSEWDGLDDDGRKEKIREGLQGMADSIVDLIDKRDLLHPESSVAV